MSADFDTVICGAGVWGLAAAWRCARGGARVALIDDGGVPAGHVAAGMLGARAEADSQDPQMLELLSEALGRWPAFSEQVASTAGRPLGDTYPGALLTASRPEHVARIRRLGETLAHAGSSAEWAPGSRLRELEPSLSPAVSGALVLPEEGQVDPRSLLAALRAACVSLGVEIVSGQVVESAPEPSGESLVRLTDGNSVLAEAVVVATGQGARAMPGQPGVRPVKGQILRLRAESAPPLTRTIRSPDVYIVARPDGEIVVGATVEERGDTRVTAGAVLDLLEDAARICPDLREAELVEASAGLRPATQDGRPLIGRTEPKGPIWAVGGYRHGVLLAPVAAELVWAEVSGRAPSRIGTIVRSASTQEVSRSLAS